MNKLYKFTLNLKGYPPLQGVFVDYSYKVDSCIGKVINLTPYYNTDESVVVQLTKNHFQEIDADRDFIMQFKRLGLNSGFNPIYYDK